MSIEKKVAVKANSFILFFFKMFRTNNILYVIK